MTAVDEWVRTLTQAGELSPRAVDQILSTHSKRGRKAIEAVGERRVKEYNDFTVVVGRAREYIIEGRSCTCPDTRYNLDPDAPTELCWHVIAALIARAIDASQHYDLWYAEVGDIIGEHPDDSTP